MSETEAILYLGDCLNVMKDLQTDPVALFFSDLPYGVTRREWDKIISLPDMWQAFEPIAKSSAKFVFTATQPFVTDLINSKRSYFKYDLIWDKTRTTGFLNANRMPLRRHEHLLIFHRSSGTYNPQKVQGKPWVKLGRGPDLNYGNVASNDHRRESDGLRHPTSILSVPSGNAGSQHPTQKPVALLEWLIKTYTKDGDTILDPCAGSGTTAIAAMNVGNRKVICIEKDTVYFEVMSKRVAEYREKLRQSSAPP